MLLFKHVVIGLNRGLPLSYLSNVFGARILAKITYVMPPCYVDFLLQVQGWINAF